MFKICEKNSSVNLRLEIFVMAFRVRKLFGTFEKRAPGQKSQGRHEVCGIKNNLRSGVFFFFRVKVGKGAERKRKNFFPSFRRLPPGKRAPDCRLDQGSKGWDQGTLGWHLGSQPQDQGSQLGITSFHF